MTIGSCILSLTSPAHRQGRWTEHVSSPPDRLVSLLLTVFVALTLYEVASAAQISEFTLSRHPTSDTCIILEAGCSDTITSAAAHEHEISLSFSNPETAKFFQMMTTAQLIHTTDDECGVMVFQILNDGGLTLDSFRWYFKQSCPLLRVNFCDMLLPLRIEDNLYLGTYSIEQHEGPLTPILSCSGSLKKASNLTPLSLFQLSLPEPYFPRKMRHVSTRLTFSITPPEVLSNALKDNRFRNDKLNICIQTESVHINVGDPIYDVSHNAQVDIALTHTFQAPARSVLCLKFDHRDDAKELIKPFEITISKLYFLDTATINTYLYLCNGNHLGCNVFGHHIVTSSLASKQIPSFDRRPPLSSAGATPNFLRFTTLSLVMSIGGTVGDYIELSFPPAADLSQVNVTIKHWTSFDDPTPPSPLPQDILHVFRDLSRPLLKTTEPGGRKVLRIYLTDTAPFVANPSPAFFEIVISDLVYAEVVPYAEVVNSCRVDAVNPICIGAQAYLYIHEPFLTPSETPLMPIPTSQIPMRKFYDAVEIVLNMEDLFPAPGTVLDLRYSLTTGGTPTNGWSFISCDNVNVTLLWATSHWFQLGFDGLSETNPDYSNRTIACRFMANTSTLLPNTHFTGEWTAKITTPGEITTLTTSTTSTHRIEMLPALSLLRHFYYFPVTDFISLRRATMEIHMVTHNFQYWPTDTIVLKLFTNPNGAPNPDLPQQGPIPFQQSNTDNQPVISSCMVQGQDIHCKVTDHFPGGAPPRNDAIKVVLVFRIEVVIPTWSPSQQAQVRILNSNGVDLGISSSVRKLQLFSTIRPVLVMSFADRLASKVVTASSLLPFFHEPGLINGVDISHDVMVSDGTHGMYMGCAVSRYQPHFDLRCVILPK